MTEDQIKTALYGVIAKHRNAGRPSEEIATAVMALVGPKPLEFNRKGAARVGRSIYVVLESEFDDGAGEIWYVMLDGKTLSSLGQFNDEESAQAAAQAHADAAHWGNTALGELE
mgnify:CR=1 FL=1